jgi:hypothetical protein
MAKIVVSAERAIDAPADVTFRYVADMRDHHPRYLPPAFSDFRVESGGLAAGTITRFTVTAGGRTREYRMGGFFERTFAPRVMRAIYADELERLNAYAHEQRPG